MRTYSYERDSLPFHVERARGLRERIRVLRLDLGCGYADPTVLVPMLRMAERELRDILKFKGVRTMLEGGA